MRVGVEIRNIHFGSSGGIAPLIRDALGTAMERRGDVEFVVYSTLFNSGFFGATPPNVRERVLPPHGYWAQLSACLREDRIDVLFRGYPGDPVEGFPNRRQIVLVPDIQHEHLPQYFSSTDRALRQRLFRAALQDVGAIATISEYARATLREFEPARSADVFLMSPASQLARLAADAPVGDAFAAKVRAIGDYFYFPANLWKHKNHERLLEAFARFGAERGRRTALVLTGHPEGWSTLRGRFPYLPVHHLGFVTSAELRHLYAHARALAFFSLYEGFGMPLLEAFECGCPVLCSNTTSLPEVAGDAALTCDPTDVAQIATLLARIDGDAELRRELAARGRARARSYRWENAADAFVAACERVAVAIPVPSPAGRPPRVSIVTPSYNQGRFLRRTIDSVIGQDYPDVEYIVVDGGSTDDSVAILASYGDRLKWTSERDRGQTDAINKGFARSTGHIRAYLNSDDTLLPGAIARVVAYFEAHPDVDMVYGDANYIDEEDRVTGRYSTAEYSFERLMHDCCVCQPAAFWRASIARIVGEFDASLDLVMDYDYWLRIDRAAGTIRHLPEVLANSRLHQETKTLSRRGEIYREIFAICRRHGGYVDRNYYLGLWHHRIHEGSAVVAALLRRVPHVDALIADAHHRWDGRKGAFARLLADPRFAPLRRFYGRLRRARNDFPREARRHAGVRGFFWDGWLAPEATIDTPSLVTGKELFLLGRPAVPCVVDIRLGDRTIHSQPLAPEVVTRVSLVVDAPGPLRVRFSSHIVDAAQRKLAFLLLGTNLFAESDVVG
jgi:glycosyltransferase involved in cell wall biosynthesis